MKKTILSLAFLSVIILSSCGPAAEDRQAMHARAKVFQDSIATMIRTSMSEAEAPGLIAPAPAPASTPAPAAPAQTPAPVQAMPKK